MQVFNTKNMKSNQRFVISILMGILSAIGLAIIYAWFKHAANISFSLIYVGIAYLIAQVIKYFGHGIDMKFSILGGACFLLSVFLTDIFMYFMDFQMINMALVPYCIVYTLKSMLRFTPGAIIKLVCVIYGVYLAFYESRIL